MWVTREFALLSIALLAASIARAESESMLPLSPGASWKYTTSKKTRISAGSEVREGSKAGTIEESVGGPSPLSTEQQTVVQVKRRIEERGVAPGVPVTVESTLHLSSSPNGVWVHRIDALGQSSGEFNPPRPVFTDPLNTAPTLSEGGPMRTTMAIKEQVRQSVTVPAGKFNDAFRIVAEGTVSGLMGPVPIDSGTIRQIVWFVPGVGVVREDRILDLKLIAPNGSEGKAFEESSKVLEAHKVP